MDHALGSYADRQARPLTPQYVKWICPALIFRLSFADGRSVPTPGVEFASRDGLGESMRESAGTDMTQPRLRSRRSLGCPPA